MWELNEIEIDVMKEIINIALSKSADSFSFFTKKKVLIRSFDFVLSDTNEPIVIKNLEKEKYHMLTTFIRGEISGACYLMFSDEEVDKLFSLTLTDDMRSNPAMLKEMGDAVLLETDNIVTASVLTQFANLFNKKIYGDVPSLQVISGSEVKEIVNEQIKNESFIIFFKTCFYTMNNEESDFNPNFLWILDYQFIEKVKLFINKKENHKIIQQLIK